MSRHQRGFACPCCRCYVVNSTPMLLCLWQYGCRFGCITVQQRHLPVREHQHRLYVLGASVWAVSGVFAESRIVEPWNSGSACIVLCSTRKPWDTSSNCAPPRQLRMHQSPGPT